MRRGAKLRLFGTYLVVMAAGAALALAVNYGLQSAGGGFEPPERVTASSSELPPEFGRLGEAWDLLQREHIDRSTLDASELSGGAIRGMWTP